MGNLVGIIANIDVMKIRHNRWQSTRVKDVMSTDLAVVHAEDQLDYALNLMRQKNIGRLPVVEENNPHKLIGIITTSDIVAKYMDSQTWLNRNRTIFLVITSKIPSTPSPFPTIPVLPPKDFRESILRLVPSSLHFILVAQACVTVSVSIPTLEISLCVRFRTLSIK